MSRKFLARASALSLAVFLAACGGDDSSTPLAGIGSDNPDTSPDTGQDDADTNTPTPTLSITANPAEVIAGNSRRVFISAFDADSVKATGVDVKVVLSSVCANSTDEGAAATFEKNSLDISEGSVFTNYTPTEACIGTDTISARWNGNDEVKAELDITVLEPPTPVLALGTYIGDVFQEGEIEILDSLPLSNSGIESDKETRLRVALYDIANKRLVDGIEHKITFYSSCSSSGWASFDEALVTPETGDANTLYTLGDDSRCTTSDTVYARLDDDFSIKAKTEIGINDTNVPEPVLRVGVLTGGTFNEGDISADPAGLRIITGQPSPETELRFAIVNASDEPHPGSHTYEFTSMCIDAERASITNGNTQSGLGIATYKASEECLGTDTVSVVINGNSDLRASVDLVVSEQSLVLGSLDGAGGFNFGALKIANKDLGYNSNETTTTDIFTAVALDEGGGNYKVLRGAKVSLELFSTCTESGRSTITSTGTTETGELISEYTANGCVGKDVIYARIQGGEELISNSVTISKKEGLDLQLGHFASPSSFIEDVIGNDRDTSLLPGVQTKLFLSIVDNATGERVKGQPLTVEFASRCGEASNADSPLSTNTSTISLGYTEILYTAKTCDLEKDTITATLTGVEGLSATAEATIALDKAPANTLTAGLPMPNSIAPVWYSTDNRETTSELRVQLKDNDGNGLPNETITFTLDNPGSDDVADLSPVDQGTTNASGFATVNIKAIKDFDNVVFRVVASYEIDDNNTLQAYSAPIAVNSKLPYEDKFSISTSNFAPDAQGSDTVKVPLMVLAADDQGNRIRGNTVVNFKTDIGSIEPDCVLDNEGRCPITWESLGVDETDLYANITAYTHGSLSSGSTSGPGSTGKIESTVKMLMATSTGVKVDLTNEDLPNNVQVVIPAGFDVGIPAEGGAFCADAYVDLDGNGNGKKYSPPVGTIMEFEVTNATLIPASSSSFTLGSSSDLLEEPKTFQGCTFVDPDPDRTEDMKLTVTVTPPGEGTVAVGRGAEVP